MQYLVISRTGTTTQPIPISMQIVKGLSSAEPDWSSQHWTNWFSSTLAPSTAKTYETAKKRFLQYCILNTYPPLPLTENLLCNFIAAQGLKHTSIKGYLLGLRYFQLELMGIDPTIGNMAVLQQTLKGVKRYNPEEVN